jgi:hypothetical protein
MLCDVIVHCRSVGHEDKKCFHEIAGTGSYIEFIQIQSITPVGIAGYQNVQRLDHAVSLKHIMYAQDNS